MKTKISAPASCGPTREIALLMADPSPARWAGTDRISAVVRGAIRRASPRPKMIPAGRRSITYAGGGTQAGGVLGSTWHGGVEARLGAYHRAPTAMSAGPSAV